MPYRKEKPPIMSEPFLNLFPTRIVAFSVPTEKRTKQLVLKLQGAELRQRTTGISKIAAKRLRTAITALCYTAIWKRVYAKDSGRYFAYKVSLVTLTLPSKQVHTDTEIVKQILSPFLEAWKKREPGLLYVWKAEVQDNGNIHFHVTSNCFIHHVRLRNDWNKACEKLGYVTRSRSENPNSTDVHTVKKVKNLAAYMVSYLSKKDLYTKVLKRFHRVYKRKLLSNKDSLYRLPRNYFRHIKRQVSCPIWSASKPLLSAATTIPATGSDIEFDVSCIMQAKDCWFHSSFFSLLPLEAGVFTDLRQLYAKWRESNQELFLIQNKVAASITVKSLSAQG